MNNLLLATTAAVVLAAPVQAADIPVKAPAAVANAGAAYTTGWYVAGSLGLNFHRDIRTPAVLGPASGGGFAGATQPLELDTSSGWLGVGSAGWGFGNGFRVEAEGSYRQNDVSRFNINTANAINVGGTVSTAALMVNVLYDFKFGSSPLIPYVGGGIGYASHRYSSVTGTVAGTINVLDDNVGAFAYQGIAGIAIALTPAVTWTFDYRYFATNTKAIGGSYTFGGGTGTETIQAKNHNNAIMTGFRYVFATR